MFIFSPKTIICGFVLLNQCAACPHTGACVYNSSPSPFFQWLMPHVAPLSPKESSKKKKKEKKKLKTTYFEQSKNEMLFLFFTPLLVALHSHLSSIWHLDQSFLTRSLHAIHAHWLIFAVAVAVSLMALAWQKSNVPTFLRGRRYFVTRRTIRWQAGRSVHVRFHLARTWIPTCHSSDRQSGVPLPHCADSRRTFPPVQENSLLFLFIPARGSNALHLWAFYAFL